MSRASRSLCALAVVLGLACSGVRSEATRASAVHSRTLTLASHEPARATLAEHAEVRPEAQSEAGRRRPVVEQQEQSHTGATPAARGAVDSVERDYPLHGVAYHLLAQVFSEPAEKAAVVGYLRRGGKFRAKEGVRAKGCDKLWHEVLGGGFVCAGRGFLLGSTPQSFTPSPADPALYAPLPYAYGKAMAHVPQYLRLPSLVEERELLALHARAKENSLRLVSRSSLKPEELLLGTKQAPLSASGKELLPDFVRMIMQPGFYVSLDGSENADERAYARTVRGAYVGADALKDVQVPALHGTVIDRDMPLPLGLVYRPGAPSYTRDTMTGRFTTAARLSMMEAFSLTSEAVLHAGRRQRVTREGRLVPEDVMRIVSPMPRPPLVPSRARWISVQLGTQTLVAYEGNRPVFATLVSSGKQGFATPTGIFRIQAKHVSTTMDGDETTEEAYSIEDVPWTMYFSGGYALHAAFWHDKLGRVRSHGCVNLAPADAQWLFHWTAPDLPTGFHGVLSTRENPGTFVVISE